MIITSDNVDQVGAYIGLRRRMTGLNQAQLARKIHYNSPGLCKIESGGMVPRLEILCDLAKVLGLEIEIRERRE